jgi:PKD repeat protein
MKRTFLLIAVAIAGSLLTGCQQEPEACFSASSDSLDDDKAPIVGEKITFTNCSVEADSYFWDFGDGETSTEANPKHTYEIGGEDDGEFQVTLEATNKKGTTTTSFDLEVLSLSGDWEGSMVIENSFDFELELEQEGENLDGNYIDSELECELKSSTIEGYDVTIKFTWVFDDGTKAAFTFIGEVNDDYDEMEGTYTFVYDGTFVEDDAFVWEASKTKSKSTIINSTAKGISQDELKKYLAR